MTRKQQHSEISKQALCAEYQAVYHYVLALCRRESLAEDITQETFLRTVKCAGGFRGSSSLYTWLCAIANNIWKNHCTQEKREMPDEIPQTHFSPDDMCEDQILRRDSTMEVHRCLHTLPEPYKEVFSLRVLGQLSYREIAELFDKTESWARVTFYRGKKLILEKLKEEGFYE